MAQRPDRDAEADLLERRWFSSIAAVTAAKAECEVLRAVIELAESAWLRARAQLAQLETLRDSLGEMLADLDDCEYAPAPALDSRQIGRGSEFADVASQAKSKSA